MNTFPFFRYGIRMLNFIFLFGQRVQILTPEYKYHPYCTPLNQSDCRYFFVKAINVIITQLPPLQVNYSSPHCKRIYMEKII